MAFPFRADLQALRESILVAIRAGGLLGLGVAGCGSTGVDDMPAMEAGASSVTNGPGGTGASGPPGTGVGSSGSGGSIGTAGTSAMGGTGAGGSMPTAGTGVAGTATPTGGVMATGGTTAPPDAGPTTVAMCPFGNGGPPTQQCLTRGEMENKAHFGCGQIPITPEPTPAEIAAAFLPNGCLPKEMACDGCCNPSEIEGLPQGDGSCCFAYCQGACCGRPFVVGGENRLAAVIERRDWLDPGVALALEEALPAGTRTRIAREWLEDARMEHASIASFARFTEELLACAAPSELVEGAQRAALDEVRHARLCFSLATRFGGVAWGPGAFDTSDAPPAASVREAARRAFVEGCVGETLAAAHARASLEVTKDPEARRALARIAEDEERHAALAWRFVAWALAGGDAGLRADVRSALAAARDAAPDAQDEEAGDAVTRDVLHHAGRLTESERARVVRAALRDVVQPCADTLLAAAPSVEGVHEQPRA